MPDANLPLLSVAAADLASLDASVTELVVLGIFGFAIGVFAGMVGVALGVVQLPILLAFGFSPAVSAGTNLGISTLTGTAAAWPHWHGRRVVLRVVLVIGIPAIAGTFLGGLFANEVREWMLLALIGAILGISAVATYRQWWSAYRKPLRPVRHRPPLPSDDPTGVSNIHPRRLAADSAMGVGIGLIGGAAGLVLGVMRMPILLNVLRMDPRYAAGTNNAIGVLAGAFGFAGHAVHGNFDLIVMAVMGMATMTGSFIGATQTGRASPTLIRLLIALLLTGVTPIVIVRAVAEFPG